MHELRKLKKKEIERLKGFYVKCIYNNYDEKMNNTKSEELRKPFELVCPTSGKWYTDDCDLLILFYKAYKNTVLDFIDKGYNENEALKLATNDEVIITSIFKLETWKRFKEI